MVKCVKFLGSFKKIPIIGSELSSSDYLFGVSQGGKHALEIAVLCVLSTTAAGLTPRSASHCFLLVPCRPDSQLLSPAF